ncbi:hypothetical protein Q2T40_06410 [Winogradskyella maritima]|uniref:Prenyltransferase n=1 Tax=Winogradskyella maritima TaxID=1517766 RepID=A0ABV8ANU2_9FLAO|nr:hypothetical protein [Winogradskyella maritima]
MKPLKALFNFYLNSSIHVALSLTALVLVTGIQIEKQLEQQLLYFVFFATITGYNFVKYFGLAKFHHRSLATWLKVIQIFSFICIGFMGYFALQLQFESLVFLAVLGSITFLYAIPLIPKRHFIDEHQNLRNIGGLKIYIIALVWALVTVGLPVLETASSLTWDVIICGIQRYLLVVVLMLPFEIRDLNYDSIKLATLPQTIGIKKTKAIGALVLILFFMLEFFKDELDVSTILSSLILICITLFFLLFSKKEQSGYYSAFWVEAIPIFWLALIVMLG